MFERYVEEARRGVFFARYESAQQGGPFIEWQHLLLGIIREPNSAANETFKLKDSEATIRSWLPRSDKGPLDNSVNLPLSSECKRILAYAAEETERLDHRFIFSDHLLLGLLREESSRKQLESLGLSIKSGREAVRASSVDRTTPPPVPYSTSTTTPETNPLTFVQRYAVVLIIMALVAGLIIGVNLRN